MAAAPPTLHLFPPVEDAQRRQESFDHMIKRSMEMRPTGPFPQRRERHVSKRVPYGSTRARSSSRQAGARNHSRTRSPSTGRSMDQHGDAFGRISLEETTELAVSAQPEVSCEQFYTGADTPNAAVQPPVRRPSVSGSPLKSALRRAPSPAINESYYYQPAAPATVTDHHGEPQSAISISSKDESPVFAHSRTLNLGLPTLQTRFPERKVSSRASRRRRVVVPISPVTPNGDEIAVITGLPCRQISSRASNHPRFQANTSSPLRRQASSRASNRPHVQFEHTDRTASPSFTETTAFSTTQPLTRSDSICKRKEKVSSPERFYYDSAPAPAPMQSLFPTYDPTVSLAQQSYGPKAPPAAIRIPLEKVCKPEYSPTFNTRTQPKRYSNVVTDMAELTGLWDAANGQMVPILTGSYNLQLHREQPSNTSEKMQRITFGPLSATPFLSLAHLDEACAEDTQHELLITRHHPSAEEILPIANLQITPPPPPSLSRTSRGSLCSTATGASPQPPHHIANLMPTVATLHALDAASKSPQAHKLALVDPRATSPAAARMAERAVKDATHRESCTLTWRRTCPRWGKYELHHPSLGVFSVLVEGDVKTALGGAAGTAPRSPTGISILNPFADMGGTGSPDTDSHRSFPSSGGSSTYGAGGGAGPAAAKARDGAILARLDLVEDVLHLQAGAIQQLGNVYLLDVCVSTLLTVALAEAKRPADPGLVFAAPPPSATMPKPGRKAKKARAEGEEGSKSLIIWSGRKSGAVAAGSGKRKEKAKGFSEIDWTRRTAVTGIEHLVRQEDLPRITRGLLGVLGAGFRMAVWVLEIGVRITASMVIGLSKLATKD